MKDGANLHVRDGDGDTPMAINAVLPDAEVLKALLKSGVDLDSLNYHGTSPLILAIRYGRVEHTTFLPRSGS